MAALSTFLVGLAVERWDARTVAAAMGVVCFAYAVLWAAMVFISRMRNASAWTGAVGETAVGAETVRVDSSGRASVEGERGTFL